MLSSQFIKAGDSPNRYTGFVPAPWFRKTFITEELPRKATVTIGTPGFYRAFLNGTEITKGPLAPYISNPDHILYYDEYDITPLLTQGKNALVILAGNGNLSAPGGSVWDFEKFPWTDAQKVAFCIELDGVSQEADGDVKCRASHILFDDLRAGERHDGRLYDADILLPGYDDGAWERAKPVFAPKGEKRICRAHKISCIGDLKGEYIGKYRIAGGYTAHKKAVGDDDGRGQAYPTEDRAGQEAFVFDFGMNTAGIPVLTLDGKKDAVIEMQFAEYIDKNGEVNYNNIDFYPDGFSQKDVYICRGEKGETFEPKFTYHGARYCAVLGLDEETLPTVSLTFRRISSAAERYVDFRCSDKNAEKLFRMCVNSDLSNLVYFPTDCPQREKNGWTGDAAISAERMSLFYDIYDDYREWMNNIRKAQRKTGEIPCIIPTDTWGYDNLGPSWDKVIAMVPAFAYKYTGRKEIAEENAEAVYAYLKYLETRMDADGLIKKDLGDWLPVDTWKRANDKVCAVASACALVDSALEIFDVCGKPGYAEFAKGLRARLIYALRRHFVNPHTGVCDNGRQGAQSLAIHSGIFTPEEKKKAMAVLIGAVADEDAHLNIGLQGYASLFPVLFENGFADLAWEMIMRKDYPSYGHFIEQGLTALPENFYLDDESNINSLNHHMFGNVALYMVKYAAGLRPGRDTVRIEPCYIAALDYAEASYSTEKGEITFRWERNAEGGIVNMLTAPEGTQIECGETKGKFIVNGKEEENVVRKGYGVFETI